MAKIINSDPCEMDMDDSEAVERGKRILRLHNVLCAKEKVVYVLPNRAVCKVIKEKKSEDISVEEIKSGDECYE